MKGLDLKNLPKDPETSQMIITKSFEHDFADKELGTLGKFFGSGNSIKMNIAGLTIFVLLLSGIGYTISMLACDTKNNPKAIGILEFWGIITPLITLALGFIFGKKDK